MADPSVVLMLIETIALFFQGFSFKRRHTLMIVISSLVVIITAGLSTILNGIDSYANTLSHTDIYDIVTALGYVILWWGCGYIIGGFQIVPNHIKVAKIKLDRGEIKMEKEKES